MNSNWIKMCFWKQREKCLEREEEEERERSSCLSFECKRENTHRHTHRHTPTHTHLSEQQLSWESICHSWSVARMSCHCVFVKRACYVLVCVCSCVCVCMRVNLWEVKESVCVCVCVCMAIYVCMSVFVCPLWHSALFGGLQIWADRHDNWQNHICVSRKHRVCICVCVLCPLQIMCVYTSV